MRIRRWNQVLVAVLFLWAAGGVALAEQAPLDTSQLEPDHTWSFGDEYIGIGIIAAHEEGGMFALPTALEQGFGYSYYGDYATIIVREADGMALNGKMHWIEALPLWRPPSNAPPLEPGAELTVEVTLLQSDFAKAAGHENIVRSIPVTVSVDPMPLAQPATLTGGEAVLMGVTEGEPCGWPAVQVSWTHPETLPYWAWPLVNYKISVAAPHESASDTGGRLSWDEAFTATLPYDTSALDGDFCFQVTTNNRPGPSTAITENECVTTAELQALFEANGCPWGQPDPQPDVQEDPKNDIADPAPETADGGSPPSSSSSSGGGCAGSPISGPLALAVLFLALVAVRHRRIRLQR